MNNQHKKNRITIITIFAMSIIPFGIAWYLAIHPGKIVQGTNLGELITPPVSSEYQQFTGYDNFTSDNLKELAGHWVLINILPTEKCTTSCADALYKTKQLTLMLGKDISRLRRAVILLNANNESPFSTEWQQDAYLLKLNIDSQLQEKLKNILPESTMDGALIIMDPLGNLMMKYAAGFDPYQVKNDLTKLLKISQIG